MMMMMMKAVKQGWAELGVRQEQGSSRNRVGVNQERVWIRGTEAGAG